MLVIITVARTLVNITVARTLVNIPVARTLVNTTVARTLFNITDARITIKFFIKSITLVDFLIKRSYNSVMLLFFFTESFYILTSFYNFRHYSSLSSRLLASSMISFLLLLRTPIVRGRSPITSSMIDTKPGDFCFFEIFPLAR